MGWQRPKVWGTGERRWDHRQGDRIRSAKRKEIVKGPREGVSRRCAVPAILW